MESWTSTDTRTGLLASGGALCVVTLFCLALAIDHWAAYVFLGLPAFCLAIIILQPIVKINDLNWEQYDEHRKVQYILTGKKQQISIPTPSFRLCTIYGVLFIFGISGFGLVCRRFYGGSLSKSDGDVDQLALALQIWFLCFSIPGSFVALLVLISLAVKLTNYLFPGSDKDFDPSVGPKIPQTTHPPYPIVVDCHASLYLSTLFILLGAIGSYYSMWFWAVAFGGVFISFVVFRVRSSHVEDCDQLQLYLDWHDHFASNQEIDKVRVTMKQEREDLWNNYKNSRFSFFLLFCFGVWPLLVSSLVNSETGITWMPWAFFWAEFLLFNYVVYRCWKQEIWELIGSRTPIVGGSILGSE